MAFYGYARVSTPDQNPAHQTDALIRSGVEAANIHTDTASGAQASRPELDLVLKLLREGDTLKVTRLDRLSRSVQHLINLGADLRERGIGLHVVEQGIDTSTMEGRAMFGMLSVLAELQRELIVANTQDGLDAARARGRTGGRRPKLTQRQLDLAQHMYDSKEHTVDQIAATFNVSRPTMYRHLSAANQGKDFALIVYRNTRSTKVDADTNRRYGETGASEKVQYDADRMWWKIAPARQHHLQAIVYVADGTVARIRAVDPDGPWDHDDRGYAAVPVSAPLSNDEVAERLPTLGLRVGEARPHVKGKLREHLTL